MANTFARAALVLAAALAVTACGSSREDELAAQLAEAQALAAQETAGREAAEREAAALRAHTNDTSLDDFYGSTEDSSSSSSNDLEMTEDDAANYREAPPQVL